MEKTNNHNYLYNELAQEVAIFRDKLKILLENNSDANEEYCGIQILFSSLLIKPKILFMGINPGNGYSVKNGEPVDKLYPLEKLEYLIEEDNNYPLAKQTIKLFELANSAHHLENSVKSNYYYIATENEKALYENFFGLIPEIKEQSKFWTLKLIDIVSPKIIICEGVSVFNNLCILFDCEKEINEYWNYAKSEKYELFCYKRFRSSIIKKEIVAEKLKLILH